MKTVNFLEALEANKHSRCKPIDGPWYEVNEMTDDRNYFRPSLIKCKWIIEEKPIEVWMNVYKDNKLGGPYLTKEFALENKSSNDYMYTAKFREVTDE